MGQSIAVLIGNVVYNDLPTLGCCANDVAQMHELLSATQKFGNIVDFVDKPFLTVEDEFRKPAELEGGLEEIPIYFTGYDLSNADDFFMCFEWFSENPPHTTIL